MPKFAAAIRAVSETAVRKMRAARVRKETNRIIMGPPSLLYWRESSPASEAVKCDIVYKNDEMYNLMRALDIEVCVTTR
jgi:hypothetical protein